MECCMCIQLSLVTSKIPEASWISPRWVPALRELVWPDMCQGVEPFLTWSFWGLVHCWSHMATQTPGKVNLVFSEKVLRSFGILNWSFLFFYLEFKERERDYITISCYGIKQTKRASTDCQLWLRNYFWYFTYIIPFILGRDIVFILWMVQGEAGSQKSSNSLEIIQLVNSGDWI